MKTTVKLTQTAVLFGKGSNIETMVNDKLKSIYKSYSRKNLEIKDIKYIPDVHDSSMYSVLIIYSYDTMMNVD